MSKVEKHVPYAQLPKPLINLPISVGAKLLFALLNDRFRLSLKNAFKDEDGFVTKVEKVYDGGDPEVYEYAWEVINAK